MKVISSFAQSKKHRRIISENIAIPDVSGKHGIGLVACDFTDFEG